MILIPEIETVVILTPRTGSGSAKKAILDKYEHAILLYRHMEADGVPHGYDRWPKVGVVRDPLDRLWSLFKFLRSFGGEYNPAYIAAMRESVNCSFNDWILNNQTPFTTPYDSEGLGRVWPNYSVLHPLPENKKSQFMYLRPDLGTDVYQFSRLEEFADRLGVELDVHNNTDLEPAPQLSVEAFDHVCRYFKWDLLTSTGG